MGHCPCPQVHNSASDTGVSTPVAQNAGSSGGCKEGGARALPQGDAIGKVLLDPRKTVSVGGVGGRLSTGTLAVVPLALSLEPHSPLSPHATQSDWSFPPSAGASGEWLAPQPGFLAESLLVFTARS